MHLRWTWIGSVLLLLGPSTAAAAGWPGEYALSGRSVPLRKVEATLEVRADRGGLTFRRTQRGAITGARVWTSSEVRRRGDALEVTYRLPATGSNRGIAGALLGQGGGGPSEENVIRARYTRYGDGDIREVALNTTRREPERWLVQWSRGRRSRQVLATIRVLSFNIHHGEGLDGRLDLPRVAATIRSVRPDLVALQEVDVRTRRTGGVDQAAELARLTGMRAALGTNLDHQGGRYGNAILYRGSARGLQNHALANVGDHEPRGVMELTVEVAPCVPVRFLATHFDAHAVSVNRLLSALEIQRLRAQSPEQPSVLAGDMNSGPGAPTLRALDRTWDFAGAPGAHPTFPANGPTKQIDYVLFAPAERWRVLEVRTVGCGTESDHRPILAVLELLAP